MKHEHEIPEYDNLTEEQRKTLLLNVAFLMNRIAYLLQQECKNAPSDVDTSEDRRASDDLCAADLVISTIMRKYGGDAESEEILDESFNGAVKVFNWIMDKDFPVCKPVAIENQKGE